jgi:hypothetical protein
VEVATFIYIEAAYAVHQHGDLWAMSEVRRDCRVPAKPRCAASELVLVQPKLAPLLFCISHSPRVPCLQQESRTEELYEHSEWRKHLHVEFVPAQG